MRVWDKIKVEGDDAELGKVYSKVEEVIRCEPYLVILLDRVVGVWC